MATERQTWSSVCVKLPPVLKRALMAEAERCCCSLNDAGVGILARRYGEPFEPSGRHHYASSPDKLVVIFRMSHRLKFKIQLDALKAGSNTTEWIVAVLAEELGVTLDRKPPRRRTPFGGGNPRHRDAARRASRRTRSKRKRDARRPPRATRKECR